MSVLTAALLAPAVLATTDTASAASPASAREDVQLVVDAITPEAPREPTTPIKLTGSLTNAGNVPLTSLRVRMRYSSRPFTRRSDLDAYLTGQQSSYDPSWSTFTQITQLDASGKLPLEVTTTPQQLRMSGFGVYPFAIEVIDAFGQQLAIQRTFLPYAPKDQKITRTRLALALPVIDQPHRADDPTFMDNGLHTSLGPNGRLSRILEVARTAPKGVTWFVDPGLLDDARQTTAPYSVKTGDKIERKPADAAAGEWLQGLRSALADVPVVATPYADPDVTALVHNGIDDATGIAVKKSAEVAQSLLGREIPTTTNWPTAGVLDRDALDELAVNGVRTLLLNSSNLPPAAPSTPITTVPPAVTPTPDTTPGTATPGTTTPATTPGTATPGTATSGTATSGTATSVDSIAGRMTVLLADPVLSQIVDTATSAAAVPALTRQRFLAETAMITVEDPGTTKTVVAAPRRRWDPQPSATTDLLKSIASVPWLRPVTLGSVKRPARTAPAADLVYSAQHRQAELSKAYLSGVRRLAKDAGLTADVTGDKSRPFDSALLRLGSSAWRGRGGEATRRVKQVRAAVEKRIADISITGADTPRNLAGANGVVPISVHNGIGSDVRLTIEVTSKNPQLLQVGTYRREIAIKDGNNQTVQVPMTAQNGGEATVTVQLATINGKPFGDSKELIVQASGYGGVALVIVGGALTVMLAAAVMRILRRRTRRVRRPVKETS